MKFIYFLLPFFLFASNQACDFAEAALVSSRISACDLSDIHVVNQELDRTNRDLHLKKTELIQLTCKNNGLKSGSIKALRLKIKELKEELRMAKAKLHQLEEEALRKRSQEKDELPFAGDATATSLLASTSHALAAAASSSSQSTSTTPRRSSGDDASLSSPGLMPPIPAVVTTAAAGGGAASSSPKAASPRRPAGTEKLSDNDFLRYTTLQKELRTLSRRKSLLNRIFLDLHLKELAQKKKVEEVKQRVLEDQTPRRKKSRKSAAQQEQEDAEVLAQFEQEQNAQRLKEAEERRERNAVLRVLRAQQVAEAQEVLALQAAQAASAAAATASASAEPQAPYFAENFETQAFSSAVESMNSHQRIALESVISDIMFTGSTHRSRGLLQGVICQVNGMPLRVDHADYFGAKNRLFYAIYLGTLVLLQAEGHDFDPRNSVVRITP